jgi:hypothetical protein
MNTPRFNPKRLVDLFERNTIATMEDMKKALGTDVDVTVFRKLKQLEYCTSYSHRGQYYTLKRVPHYDQQGLWFFEAARFSRHGTLLATIEAFVQQADAGYFTDELEAVLAVGVKEALLKLTRQERIARTKLGARYLYCSTNARVKKRQISARRVLLAEPSVAGRVIEPSFLPDEIKAAIVLFFSLLDEKQQRLYAGLEALKLGHGGDRKMAQLLGLDVNTIARGRQQLVAQDVELDRVRRAGAGRKSVEKKRRKSSDASESS